MGSGAHQVAVGCHARDTLEWERTEPADALGREDRKKQSSKDDAQVLTEQLGGRWCHLLGRMLSGRKTVV